MVGISLLNTAWMCGFDKGDKGKIMLGLSQINRSWFEIRDCQIKLAISHHHYNFLEENEGKKVREVLHKHYDIFPLGILMIQKQHMKKMLTVVCLSL